MSPKTTRFEKLLEAVPDALVGMEQKGVIRFVNAQTELLFGYHRDDLIGQPIETLVPEPLRQIYAENRDEYFADPRTRSSGLELELSGLKRDATAFPINISMAYIDTGDVLLVIRAMAELTKRQVAIKNAALATAIVDSSEDAIIGTNLGGVLTSWNPAAERMYGYSSQETIGRSVSLLAPDRAGAMSAALARIKDDEAVEHVEATLVRKDGSMLPVSITVSSIRDEDDVVVGACMVHRDVSEQRKAFETAQRMAAIVEHSDDAIVSRGLDDAITSWNPAAERMFGYSSQEVIGKSASLLIPEEQAGELESIGAKVRDGNPAKHLESVRIRKDGTAVPVSLTVSPIYDQGGTLVGASTICRDVTQQRKAFESAQRMAAIIDNSDDAIIGTTLEGMITGWNPAAERMYGYSNDEIVGKPIELLSPTDRGGEVNAILAKIKAGQPVENLETLRIRKDRTVLSVSLTVSPICDEHGAIVGASTIARDLAPQEHAAIYARSLIEAALDPLVTISPEGKINDVNKATVKATGIPRDHLIGTDFSGYFTEPDKAHKGYQRALTKGSVTDYPLTLRHRDGTLSDVLYSAAVYADPAGNMLGVFAAARDVTQARQALALAQRMAAIIEGSDDAIMSGSLDGSIVSWNPAAMRMFGYDSAEIIGKDAKTLAPKDRATEFKDVLHKIRAGRQVEHLETKRVRKDGTVFPVSLTMSPLRDADGAIIGASAIYRDVTQQKLAIEVAQRMAAIVESSSDAIIGNSLDGIITSWNPAAERMYGYRSAEIIGKNAATLTPKDRAGEVKDVLDKIEAGRQVEHLETKRVRKDGTVFPVSLTVSAIRDADGTIVGGSLIHRDLSEQKGALAVAQRIAAIVENSDDAIVGRTLDGIITSWNPAAARIFGYSGEEILGKSIDVLVPEDRAGEFISNLANISAGKSVKDSETIRIRKDAKAITVSLTISPIRDEKGMVVGASEIYRDLTELKHAARYARSLIEAALDPLVTISPDGKINDVNNATLKVTGVPRNRLIGTDFSHYFTDPDKAHQGYQRAFTQGLITDYPLTLRHRDGTLTDVMYNASVYRDATGKVLGVLAAARDMTKQRRTFEAAQRMAAIVQYSDNAIIGTTLDGTITSWNPAAERMYGYSSEKIVRRSVDLLSPQDRTGEIISILAEIATGTPVDNFETICTRKDRTTFPVKLTIAPIRSLDGAVIGASAIARDVTQQRQALAAAQKMEAIVEFSGEAIIGCTLEGVITSWNPAAARMFGYTSQEMVGKSGLPLSPKDRAEETTALLTRIKAGQPVEGLETTRIRKDGMVFAVSLNVTPIYDPDGAIVAADMLVRDMTEQKDALAAAQRLASMVEFSGGALMSGTLDGIITSWNPAAERMYGYSSTEILGKSDRLMTPEDRTGEVKAILAKFRAGQNVEQLETLRIRKDGTVFPVSLTIAPIRDADQAIVGLSAIARDMTVRT